MKIRKVQIVCTLSSVTFGASFSPTAFAARKKPSVWGVWNSCKQAPMLYFSRGASLIGCTNVRLRPHEVGEKPTLLCKVDEFISDELGLDAKRTDEGE